VALDDLLNPLAEFAVVDDSKIASVAGRAEVLCWSPGFRLVFHNDLWVLRWRPVVRWCHQGNQPCVGLLEIVNDITPKLGRGIRLADAKCSRRHQP